jgi:thymidylate synthase
MMELRSLLSLPLAVLNTQMAFCVLLIMGAKSNNGKIYEYAWTIIYLHIYAYLYEKKHTSTAAHFRPLYTQIKITLMCNTLENSTSSGGDIGILSVFQFG